MTTQTENKNSEIPRLIPQFFDFDKAIISEDQPVNKKIAIEWVDKNGTIIQAETNGLYSKKIRITCPKTAPIIEGNTLDLNFTGIYKKLPQAFFLKIPCTLEKVDHFKHITHAVIVFNQPLDSPFISWYQKWITKNRLADKRKTIDKNALNFIYQYYKRLYCEYLPYPVLFSDGLTIKHAFISKPGLGSISFTDEEGIDNCIPASAFQPYINNQNTASRIPLFVWIENNHIFYFSTADYPEVSPKKIISWLIKKTQWRILLIRNQKTVSVDKAQQEEITQLFTEETINTQAVFVDSFRPLLITTHILDISCVFTQIDFPEYKTSFSGKEFSPEEKNIHYHHLSFKVKRSEPRYDYATTISLTPTSHDLTIIAETTNISFLGLYLKLGKAEYPFKEHDLVSIEFIQWNEMLPKSLLKKTEKLGRIGYKIVNVKQDDDGGIILGLLRESRDTDSKANSFIQNKMDEIKQTVSGSVKNNIDLYKSLSASLWVNNNISGLVFFLGRDSEGIRIIQAIANTQGNIKLQAPYSKKNNWSFLQKHALSLSVEANNVSTDINNPFKKLNVGIYCYYDDTNSTPEWKSKSDLNFKSAEDKSDFINMAIKYKRHFFYHCSVIAIKPGKDEILNDESSALVSLGPNRLKKIHQTCRSLIAVGELNDVTRLIEFIYKPN